MKGKPREAYCLQFHHSDSWSLDGSFLPETSTIKGTSVLSKTTIKGAVKTITSNFVLVYVIRTMSLSYQEQRSYRESYLESQKRNKPKPQGTRLQLTNCSLNYSFIYIYTWKGIRFFSLLCSLNDLFSSTAISTWISS